jgi:hypothetical protein
LKYFIIIDDSDVPIEDTKSLIDVTRSRSTTSIEDLIESTIEKTVRQKNIDQVSEVIQDDDDDCNNNDINNTKENEIKIDTEFKIEEYQNNSNEAKEYQYDNEINHMKYFDINSISGSNIKPIDDDINDNKSFEEESYNSLKNKIINTNYDDSNISINEPSPSDSSHLYDQFLQFHKEQVEEATNERIYLQDGDDYCAASSSSRYCSLSI